jgi:hypothetical protein
MSETLSHNGSAEGTNLRRKGNYCGVPFYKTIFCVYSMEKEKSSESEEMVYW